MHVVGLTGGIATGKSTVAGFLRERGVPVIDADQVARAVVEPGSPTLAALVEAFAPSPILDVDGRLDRGSMRARIAADPEAKRLLDGITHPAIGAAILDALGGLAAQGTPFAVVEAALMVETGSYRRYPTLIVVTCAPDTQLRRVVERDGGSADAARALIARQLPLADKEAVATHLIRNDGDLGALRAATDDVWDAITGARGSGPGT